MEKDIEIVIVPDTQALAREAAGRFADLAVEAAAARGRFSAVLSGGSTPGPLYRLLSEATYRSRIPWPSVHLFWGDERCVPPDQPGSNYGLAQAALIGQVPIPAENVHRIPGELEPGAAARAYERELHDFFCGPHTRFDLVLLGLGSDGHTASLFPGSPLLAGSARLAAAVTARYEDRPAQRVTLTPPAINTARQILFLVQGRDKAAVVQAVLEGADPDLPARRIRPTAGRLTWLLDRSAASRLAEP
jgi:6-phosphogluconolactonase